MSEEMFDHPGDAGEPPEEERLSEQPRLRRRPRRVLRYLFTLLAGIAAAVPVAARSVSESEAAVATDVEELSGEPERVLRLPEHGGVVGRSVAWEGKAVSATDFDRALFAGYREVLGFLADRCETAEQCFYYYGNQLDFDTRPLEVLTGRSTDELEWIGRTIREGFARQAGAAIGESVVGVAEVGRSLLPPMAKVERAKFLRFMYERHLTSSSDAYADARIVERAPGERVAIASALAKVLETETKFSAMSVQVRYAVRAYDDFGEWFDRGVGSGLPAGATKWEDAYGRYREAVREFHAYQCGHPTSGEEPSLADARAGLAVLRAEEAYRMERAAVFGAARDRARSEWFSEGDAARWSDRLREEEQARDAVQQRMATFAQAAMAIAAKE